MAFARVRRIALVVILNRLARVHEEDRVAIRAPGLEMLDRVASLQDAVWVDRVIGVVLSVYFLPQDRALQRAAGLPFLLQGESVGQDGVIQKARLSLVVIELRFPVVFAGKGSRDVLAINKRTGVEPGLRQRGWHVRSSVDVGALPQSGVAVLLQDVEFLCIELLHHPEAAEFALGPVEVAMMVRITGYEPVTADLIEGFYALDRSEGG